MNNSAKSVITYGKKLAYDSMRRISIHNLSDEEISALSKKLQQKTEICSRKNGETFKFLTLELEGGFEIMFFNEIIKGE